MLIEIDESKITYGLEDGWLGKFTHPCPCCGGPMRDWGTSGDFSGNEWMTWKCQACGDGRTPKSGRLFSEALPRNSDVLARRYAAQKAALAKTRGHFGTFPQRPE